MLAWHTLGSIDMHGTLVVCDLQECAIDAHEACGSMRYTEDCINSTSPSLMNHCTVLIEALFMTLTWMMQQLTKTVSCLPCCSAAPCEQASQPQPLAATLLIHGELQSIPSAVTSAASSRHVRGLLSLT